MEMSYTRVSPFLFRKEDTLDLISLIDGRINDQHTNTQVDKRIIAHFVDGVSSTFTEQDFWQNGVSRDVLCEKLSIQLAYLISFTSDSAPQKQEIRVDFSTRYGPQSTKKSEVLSQNLHTLDFLGDSLIEVNVRYTQPSFGNDVLNLIKARIKKNAATDKMAASLGQLVFQNSLLPFWGCDRDNVICNYN